MADRIDYPAAILKSLQLEQPDDDDDAPSAPDVGNAFFELANAPEIRLNLKLLQLDDDTDHESADKNSNKNYCPAKDDAAPVLLIRQDVTACGKHTGGIVWETSYLLLHYLIHKQKQSPTAHALLGKTLEVGAGCGLLGLALAALAVSSEMVLTETAEVLVQLRANVERNVTTISRAGKKTDGVADKNKRCCIHTSALDWTRYDQDVKRHATILQPHAFDTVIGTDVIFAPALVEPLLETLQYMSRQDTVIYLCVQERCATSHALFLQQAPRYGFELQDISSEYQAVPLCFFGKELECILFKLTRGNTCEQQSKKQKTTTGEESQK